MKAAPNHSFYNIFYKKIDFHKSKPADDWKIIFLMIFLSLINFNRKRFYAVPGTLGNGKTVPEMVNVVQKLVDRFRSFGDVFPIFFSKWGRLGNVPHVPETIPVSETSGLGVETRPWVT